MRDSGRWQAFAALLTRRRRYVCFQRKQTSNAKRRETGKE
jgi:hypothetical protein